MKIYLRLFILLFVLSVFSCPAPTVSSISRDEVQAPHVTHEALKNTVYAGMRTKFGSDEDQTKKYLYVEFFPKSSYNEVLARLGRGATADEAKQDARNNANTHTVTLKGLEVVLGHELTIYMDEDLKKGVTKTRIYSGGSIYHVSDATLVKQ